MKNSRLTLSVLILMFCFYANALNEAQIDAGDPEVVAEVDFQKYSGKWFEIAHSPNFFQRNCLHSEATYQVLSETSVSVYNKCYKKNGKTSDIDGVATVTDPAVPAKLKVRFSFFQRGDYWITELDKNYQWAVVSGPQKKSIFILSRTAPMEPKLLGEILDVLYAKGYRTNNLIFDQYE